MKQKKETKTLWGLIGKAATLVALVWGSIQIYNNFFRTPDYKLIASGNHGLFILPPEEKANLDKFDRYNALFQTLGKGDVKISNWANIDSIINALATGPSYSGLKYELLTRKYKDYRVNSIWSLDIKNSGSNPLEELTLEVPFEGAYQLTNANGAIVSGYFSKRIPLDTLNPSYTLHVTVWADVPDYMLDNYEDDCRITHKKGWSAINFPVLETGVWAWIKKKDYAPLSFVIFVLIVLIFLAYGIGYVKAKREPPVGVDSEVSKQADKETDENGKAS